MGQEALSISEMFRSIQGESTWAGLPCTFVRLAGCDVGCAYCDTRYAAAGGIEMPIDHVLAACEAFGERLVEITGGEPLLQAGTPALAAALLETGRTVLVETSGTRPIDVLPAGAIRIMDLKCPGSGVADRNHWPNMEHLTSRDEVKFVITSREDFDWSCDAVRRYDLASRCHAVLFSPAFGTQDPRELAEWLLETRLRVRFQLQLHKYVWPPNQRGV